VVQIPLIDPPEILLPSGPQKIIFVSRFDTTKITFTKQQITDVYKESYTSFVDGIKQGFESIEHLNLHLPDTLIHGKWYTSSDPKFTDFTHIPGLLNTFQPDYLLTLDGFELIAKSEEEIEYGIKYYSNFVESTAALTLYDKNAEVVDKMLMEDREFIERRVSADQLGDFGHVSVPLSFYLGYDYALMFIDYKSYEERYMYSGKSFKNVITLAQQEKWQQCKTALLPLTQNENIKIAQQAAHNMAVVETALGNYTESLLWSQKAESRKL
jgi:hypothetical protein